MKPIRIMLRRGLAREVFNVFSEIRKRTGQDPEIIEPLYGSELDDPAYRPEDAIIVDVCLEGVFANSDFVAFVKVADGRGPWRWVGIESWVRSLQKLTEPTDSE